MDEILQISQETSNNYNSNVSFPPVYYLHSQSFTPESDFDLTRISLYLKSPSPPVGDIILSLYADSLPASPHDTSGALLTVTIDGSGVETDFNWIDFPLASPYGVSEGTEYFFIIKPLEFSGMYWATNTENPYTGGYRSYYDGVGWTNTSADVEFRIYSTAEQPVIGPFPTFFRV